MVSHLLVNPERDEDNKPPPVLKCDCATLRKFRLEIQRIVLFLGKSTAITLNR
jgi:hypothetical protein